MENERLLEISTDCELGSSFDEYLFNNDHDKMQPKLGSGGGGDDDDGSPKRRKSRTRAVSPSAAAPREDSKEDGRRQDAAGRVPGSEPAERASAAADNSFTSSHDEEEHFVPLSAERQGTIVEGDLASRDLHAYRVRKRHGEVSGSSFDEAEMVRPPKTKNSGSPSAYFSAYSRQDSGGFDYEATAAEAAKDRSERQEPKRVTPFAYLSSGCESPASDRDDCPEPCVEQIPSVGFTPKTPTERNPTTSSQAQHNTAALPSTHVKSFLPGHHRSVSSPVNAAQTSQPGHQRSASSPAQTLAGRHQDISSRMSELQRQLQGRTADSGLSPMRRMRSQGDLSPSSSSSSSSRARSKISDLIGQLSNRLKKRDERHRANTPDNGQESFSLYRSRNEDHLENSQESFSLYRTQSEPLVASMAAQKLAESPRVPPPHRDKRRLDNDSLLEEDEDSFVEEDDASDVPVAEHNSIYLEEWPSHPGRKEAASSQVFIWLGRRFGEKKSIQFSQR